MSRRNNPERLGAPHLDASTPPIVSQAQENPFSFVVPTEFIDLPSEGKFYGPDHPMHGKDTIEIRHLTAKEEDILTSESLLRKGVALDRLLESIILDKSVRVDDLLVGDKNAILVGARITGYGPLYQTRVTCPECETQVETIFHLENIKIYTPTVRNGVVPTEHGTYLTTLPRVGAEIEIRLVTGKIEREFLQNNQKRKKMKLPEDLTTSLLSTIVVSVNGDPSAQLLTQLFEVLPISDSRFIKEVYEELCPNVDLTHDFLCSECQHDGRIAVPLTADFFWPNR